VQKGFLVNFCRDKHTLITLLEDGKLEVQEQDGHNNSLSVWTGHDSNLESSEEVFVAETSRVSYEVRPEFLYMIYLHNPSSRSMALVSTQPLRNEYQEYSWTILGGKGRPALRADKLAAIYEPIV
jgi:hypothetical protein